MRPEASIKESCHWVFLNFTSREQQVIVLLAHCFRADTGAKGHATGPGWVSAHTGQTQTSWMASPASSASHSSKPEPKGIAITGALKNSARAEACFSRAAWGNPQIIPQSTDYGCSRHMTESHTKKEDVLGQSQDCHPSAATAIGQCSTYAEK